MRKLKMLIVAMLVFMMSAQTVLGAAVPKANAESEAVEAVQAEEQVSENELQSEADKILDNAAKETNLTNSWDSHGITMKDINGSKVNMNGEPGCVKIVMLEGYFGSAPYTVELMEWLGKQFMEFPKQVKFIVIDRGLTSADELKEYVSSYDFSQRAVLVPGKNIDDGAGGANYFKYRGSIVSRAFGNEWTGWFGPIVYVIDSKNAIKFVSVGNWKDDDGMHQLVDYVNGMEEIAGVDPVERFVTRLYAYALGRQPDTAGLNDWVTRLKSKQISGTTAARGFFDSEELKNRKLSNEQYVELLYRVMMGRSADAAGKAYWVNMLGSGVSRMGVFNGFAGSTEFDNICKEYGIDRGAVVATEGRDKNYGVTQFVSRLYTQALGRDYDVDGLNDWCNRIVGGNWNVTDVATTGFFNSREFANKNLNNEQYVKVLYRTFLGREYDAAGLKDWVGKLNSGAMSRDEVLKGFSYSTEFANIMKQYGL